MIHPCVEPVWRASKCLRSPFYLSSRLPSVWSHSQDHIWSCFLAASHDYLGFHSQNESVSPEKVEPTMPFTDPIALKDKVGGLGTLDSSKPAVVTSEDHLYIFRHGSGTHGICEVKDGGRVIRCRVPPKLRLAVHEGRE